MSNTPTYVLNNGKSSEQLGISRIILETDASELEKGQVWIEALTDVYSSNKVADCVASYGASVVSSGSTAYMSQVPAFITDLVSSDRAGAV